MIDSFRTPLTVEHLRLRVHQLSKSLRMEMATYRQPRLIKVKVREKPK